MRLTLVLFSLLAVISAHSNSLQSDLEKLGKEFERAIKKFFEEVKERGESLKENGGANLNRTEGIVFRNVTNGSNHPFPIYKNSSDGFGTVIDRILNGTRLPRANRFNETDRYGLYHPHGRNFTEVKPSTDLLTFEEFLELVYLKNNATRVARSAEESGESMESEESSGSSEESSGDRHTKRPHRHVRNTRKPARGHQGTGRPTDRPFPTGEPSGTHGPVFESTAHPLDGSTEYPEVTEMFEEETTTSTSSSSVDLWQGAVVSEPVPDANAAVENTAGAAVISQPVPQSPEATTAIEHTGGGVKRRSLCCLSKARI